MIVSLSKEELQRRLGLSEDIKIEHISYKNLNGTLWLYISGKDIKETEEFEEHKVRPITLFLKERNGNSSLYGMEKPENSER